MSIIKNNPIKMLEREFAHIMCNVDFIVNWLKLAVI